MSLERRGWFAALSPLFESRYFVPVVTSAGILFRLLLLFAVRHNSVFLDEKDYEAIGISIWKGGTFSVNGWPTAFRPPAQPLLIGTLYGLFGQHALAVKVFEILFLGALPALCAILGRTVGLSKRAANLGTLFAAFHPGIAYASTTLYPTAVTAVALTLAVTCSALAYMKGRTFAAVLGGIGYGISAMSTSTFVPLPVLVGLYFAFSRKYKLAVVIGLLGVLPTAIWVARNRVTMGSWLLATNGGVNLYIGANDEASPTTENWVTAPFQIGEHEVEEDRAYTSKAKAWIRTHRLRYATVSAGRALMVADSVGHPKTKGAHSGALSHLLGWAMLPVVLLGIAGLAIFWRDSASRFTLAALVLVAVSSGLTLVKPRFRFPCDPLLGTFAAGTLSYALQKTNTRNTDHGEL